MEHLAKEDKLLLDKLTTSVYQMQASEWEFTENLLETVEEMERFFQRGSILLGDFIPRLREQMDKCPKQKVFGVDLVRHMRWEIVRFSDPTNSQTFNIRNRAMDNENFTIALPLKLGYEGLKKYTNHLKDEGIFR